MLQLLRIYTATMKSKPLNVEVKKKALKIKTKCGVRK